MSRREARSRIFLCPRCLKLSCYPKKRVKASRSDGEGLLLEYNMKTSRDMIERIEQIQEEIATLKYEEGRLPIPIHRRQIRELEHEWDSLEDELYEHSHQV